MPPKKSKAARKTDILDDKAAGGEPHELPDQNGHADDAGKVSDVASSSGPDQDVQVNIFKEEIVEGKRKRNAPVAEQTLLDWYCLIYYSHQKFFVMFLYCIFGYAFIVCNGLLRKHMMYIYNVIHVYILTFDL